ncbi:uncharacterized protein LOC124465348 [Hypomesus transpacificus]|uniref:uncharacterized protein LOC124465348 n=1 Tax=Hypomesus transpacificus TaxID=137520 RepID=UPI001F07C1C3|nr:uncharacterized protein LOC124465348 [Hypomesus transpacificus]
MDRRDFLIHCRQTFNDCCRQLLTDNVEPNVIQPTITRLETIKLSLGWAAGHLITVAEADNFIQIISDFTQEVQNNIPLDQDVPGYQAPRVYTGLRGQPRYNITEDQLGFLVSCGFTGTEIAAILQVSRTTIKNRLREFNLTRASQYAQLTDAELDDLVTSVVGANEQLGPESVRAQLRANGVLVKRSRVRSSMIRINPRAAALRAMSHRLHRRAYRVAGPNSLWHIDGNHKLIRWRIVIHGGIDGYSRLVVFLNASNNNRSQNVMMQFMNAIGRYGVPSRVRCDFGGENNDVCLFMEVYRGLGRGSALRGRSTHNQRIERLWGDVWRGINNVYHDLFSFLESDGIIDIDNEMHLWALHYVYLPRINKDLRLFCSQWNNHGLRTERNRSPLQLFVRGSLELQGRPLTAIRDLFARDLEGQGAAGAGIGT